jgi:hypothetical protein
MRRDIGWRQKIVDALWGGDDKAKESVDWAKHDPAWSAYGVLRHRLKIAWWSAAQLLAAPKNLHSSIRYSPRTTLLWADDRKFDLT